MIARKLLGLLLVIIAVAPVLPSALAADIQPQQAPRPAQDFSVTAVSSKGNHTVLPVGKSLPVISNVSLTDDWINVTVCNAPNSEVDISSVMFEWNTSVLTYHDQPQLPSGWYIDVPESNPNEGVWLFTAGSDAYEIKPGDCKRFDLPLDLVSQDMSSGITDIKVTVFFDTGASKTKTLSVFVDTNPPKVGTYEPPASELRVFNATKLAEELNTTLVPDYMAFIKPLNINGSYFVYYNVSFSDSKNDSYIVLFDNASSAENLLTVTAVSIPSGATPGKEFIEWIGSPSNVIAKIAVTVNVTGSTGGIAEGWYIVNVTGHDYAGHSSDTLTIAFYPDNQPPYIAGWSIEPVANSTYSAVDLGTPITITINVSDNSLFYKYLKSLTWSSINGSYVTIHSNIPDYTVEVSLAGNYLQLTITYPGDTVGVHDITIDLADAAGNTNTSALHLAFVVDREPPQVINVTLTSSAQNFSLLIPNGTTMYINGSVARFEGSTEFVNLPSAANLTVTVSDDTRWSLSNIYSAPVIPELRVYYNATVYSLPFTEVSAGTAYYYIGSRNGMITNVLGITNTAADQIVVVNVNATDPANRSSTTYSFTVYYDVHSPSISFLRTEPAISGSYIGSRQVTLVFSASDNFTGICVPCTEIYVNGVPISSSNASLLAGPTYNQTAGELTFTINFTQDGTYTVTVKIYDGAGNTNTSSVTFTVDTQPPTITFISVTPMHRANNVIYTNTTPTFQFRISDAGMGVNASSIKVYVDGSEVGYTVTANNTPSHMEIEVRLSGLSEGEHTVTVEAADLGGWGTSVPFNFIVDATPPELNVTKVADIYGGVVLKVAVSDALSGVDKLVLNVNGTVITIPYSVFSSSNIYLCASTCKVVDTNAYPYNVTDFIRTYMVEQDTPFALVYLGKLVVYTGATVNMGVKAYDNVGNRIEDIMAGVGLEGAWFPLILQPGWNLVSVPVLTELKLDTTTIAERLIGTASVRDLIVYWYNTSSGSWLFWSPLAAAISTLKQIEDGKAYWVYVSESITEPVVLVVDGKLEPPGGNVTLPVYDVEPGWNMLGYIVVGNITCKRLTGSGGYLPSEVYSKLREYIIAWNPVTKSWMVYYFDKTTGSGSWIKGVQPGSSLLPDKLCPGVGMWVFAYEPVKYVPPWGQAKPVE